MSDARRYRCRGCGEWVDGPGAQHHATERDSAGYPVKVRCGPVELCAPAPSPPAAPASPETIDMHPSCLGSMCFACQGEIHRLRAALAAEKAEVARLRAELERLRR